MIDIGCYIEAAIEWLTEEGAVFFDALNVGVESFIDSFQLALYAIPFYVFIPLTVLLAWWKVGKGMGAFTLGTVADMGYGILGGNHANACLSAFLHLHGFADRNPTRHLGGKK